MYIPEVHFNFAVGKNQIVFKGPYLWIIIAFNSNFVRASFSGSAFKLKVLSTKNKTMSIYINEQRF